MQHQPNTSERYANLETNFVFLGNPDVSVKSPSVPAGFTATDDLWK